MKVTKRNGIVNLFDDEKVVRSIQKANAEAEGEELPQSLASHLADLVFQRLTAENDIITTRDVRRCVYALLKEYGLPLTAERYMDYKK